MEPDSPKGAGREGEVQSHPFVTTVCPLLSSDDCSNPLGWVNARHACEGGHVTTAVPLPTSVALQTGRALPGAGEQQTFVAGYLQADPEGNEHRKQGAVAFRVHEVAVLARG